MMAAQAPNSRHDLAASENGRNVRTEPSRSLAMPAKFRSRWSASNRVIVLSRCRESDRLATARSPAMGARSLIGCHW